MSVSAPAPLISLSDQARSDTKIADLNELSRTSRIQRGKIQRKLQLARHAEHHDVAVEDKLALLRDAINDTGGTRRDGKSAGANRGWGRRILTITLFFAVQAVILCLLVRWASSRAERLFLTTYFDPFFPALYSPSPPPASLPPLRPSRLWDLLNSVTGQSMPPPPPPPSHVFFDLVPRSSLHPMVLKLMDRIAPLLTSPLSSLLDLEDVGGPSTPS